MSNNRYRVSFEIDVWADTAGEACGLAWEDLRQSHLLPVGTVCMLERKEGGNPEEEPELMPGESMDVDLHTLWEEGQYTP